MFKILLVFGGVIHSACNSLWAVEQPGECAALQRLMESRIDQDAPGLAVAVLDRGRTAFLGTRGLANLHTQVPITTQTQFYLASVSKQFTAVAIARLEEQGRLNYDETLADIFSDLPPHLRGITVDQLLRHTSGLGDYLADSSPPQTNDEVLERIRGTKALTFPPGTGFRYSNTGYNLLATCVQKVSRENFPDFMKKEIFEPQNMSRTLVCTSLEELTETRAVGYRLDGSSFVTMDYHLRTFGDGGIFSTLEDMKNWCRALETSAVLKPANLGQLFTARALSGGQPSDYARGWFVQETEVGTCIHHGGSLGGYRSRVAWYPELKIWIILLANRNDLNLDAMSREVFKIYRGEGRDGA